MAGLPPNERRDPAGDPQRPQQALRARFRWELLLVPLALLLGVVLYEHAQNLAPRWSNVMDALRISQPARFTNLAVLATGLVAALAILSVLVSNRR